MPWPSDPAALAAVHELCGERHASLVSQGCDPEVAMLRVCDCYEALFEEGRECVDARDRLFARELRDRLEKG